MNDCPLYSEIEDYVPHQHSKLWQVHREYYKQTGTDAFTRQEVPYNISSNPCLARQYAQLLLQHGPAEDSLHVLELGAGSGIFALNFLRQWQELSPDRELQYWLSDYALNSLQTLAQHEAFAPFLQSGTLRLIQMDATTPEEVRDLDAQPLTLPETGFALILGQYLFSTFPCAVLLRQGEQWLQQETALKAPLLSSSNLQASEFWPQLATLLRHDPFLEQLPEEHPQYAMFASLQRARQEIAEQIEAPNFDAHSPREQALGAYLEQAVCEAWSQDLGAPETPELRASVHKLVVQPILDHLHSQLCPPESWQTHFRFRALAPHKELPRPQDREWIEQLVDSQPCVSFNYAPAMLDAVRALLPHLSPDGLLIFGDKAYAELPPAGRLEAESPARHGRSLSHPANFPLLEAALAAQGCQVLRTQDASNALQCLIAQKPGPQADAQILELFFKLDFGALWGNEISHALLEGGYALMQQGQLEAALRHFLKALSFRPEDGSLQYLAAVCQLHAGQAERALELLERPHDDIFGVLNRDVLLGEAYRLTGRDPEAIAAYGRSLQYGENALSYLNMAACQQRLGDDAGRDQSLKHARALVAHSPELLTEIESEWNALQENA